MKREKLLSVKLAENANLDFLRITPEANQSAYWHAMEVTFCDGGGNAVTMFLNNPPGKNWTESLKRIGCDLISLAGKLE